MLSGYCGTLMTPMAANFNIVLASLLEIDKNAVIRAQAGADAANLQRIHSVLSDGPLKETTPCPISRSMCW